MPRTDPDDRDAEARWLALHRALVPDLYRVVSRRVGADRALAEDVVQDVWLRALGAWQRGGVPADPGAWLCTAAFNLLRNHYRDRRAREAFDAATLAAAEATPDGTERAALVQWGLARLAGKDAALLAARHFDARSLAELAADHGLSERAVEGRLRRARAKLAHVLRRHGAAPDEWLQMSGATPEARLQTNRATPEAWLEGNEGDAR
jgi:RNA polymerase sigma factor (sigma-70 family)